MAICTIKRDWEEARLVKPSDGFKERAAKDAQRIPGWLAFPISMLRRDFDSYCDEELKKIGLKRGYLHFILFVGRYPGCTQKDFTSLFGVDAGHSTRYVAQLVKEGFIEQRRNENDGRSRTLYLTERGTEAFARSRQILDEWDALATTGLSEEEQTRLKSLLNRVLAERMRGRIGIDSAPRSPSED